nr:TRAM domain-containing protein [Halocatena pleomorpha]
MFSATVAEHDGRYVIEVPSNEIEQGALAAEKTYRVALLDAPSSTDARPQPDSQESHSQHHTSQPHSDPPVETGEIRDETIGDQGDGIAKVERGYVVIVPGGHPGDELTVEIDQVRDNVAFASVVNRDPRVL